MLVVGGRSYILQTILVVGVMNSTNNVSSRGYVIYPTNNLSSRGFVIYNTNNHSSRGYEFYKQSK
jgi:hypothetical protein